MSLNTIETIQKHPTHKVPIKLKSYYTKGYTLMLYRLLYYYSRIIGHNKSSDLL